jgi:multidrug efflux pump subunit AcrA (membrane-fusion protein)
VELDKQHELLEVIARAHTQDLLSRGLTNRQVKEIERGDLVTDVRVVVPSPLPTQRQLASSGGTDLAYEVQEIKVEVGQQVQAGDMLAKLANHHSLSIEGKALSRDAPQIEAAARNNHALEVEFSGEEPADWNRTSPQLFTIRSIANSVDPQRRLLHFQVLLANEGEPLERKGQTFLLWRYRPGQRVKLRVPVEKWEKVLVLPAGAVVKEGPEAFVFRRDGDSFDRKPVHLLYEDGRKVVLDPERSEVSVGQHIAHQNAAALNRVLKAKAGEGGGHGHDHPH